ncbi:hypothetical protein ZWY2020_042120 [Hordeum vulgare]|nr:hypothetical protein ZWY2020_042120 [Hordeum vulgare]
MVVPLPSLGRVSALVAAAGVHRVPTLSFRRSPKAWADWAEDGDLVELPVSLAQPQLGVFLEAAWQARPRARPAASRRRLPTFASRARPTSVLAGSDELPGLSPWRPFHLALVACHGTPFASGWSRGRAARGLLLRTCALAWR